MAEVVEVGITETTAVEWDSQVKAIVEEQEALVSVEATYLPELVVVVPVQSAQRGRQALVELEDLAWSSRSREKRSFTLEVEAVVFRMLVAMGSWEGKEQRGVVVKAARTLPAKMALMAPEEAVEVEVAAIRTIISIVAVPGVTAS